LKLLTAHLNQFFLRKKLPTKPNHEQSWDACPPKLREVHCSKREQAGKATGPNWDSRVAEGKRNRIAVALFNR